MQTYIYRFFDSYGSLLYVGITKDFKNRMSNHSTSQPWWPEVSRMEVDFLPSWEEASSEEVLAISLESPRYNSRNDQQKNPEVYKERHRPITYQPLPEEEVSYMLSLEDESAVKRAFELYRAGWSMPAILKGVRVTPSSAWLVNQFGFHHSTPTGRPLPDVPMSPSLKSKESARVARAHQMRKQLEQYEVDRLKELQELTSRYRKTMASTHPSAVAAGQYREMIRSLRERGVRVREIADAVGVDESNIRRRLK